jgi:DNA-directed RNA polymerase I, II, and III subunit RPABC1
MSSDKVRNTCLEMLDQRGFAIAEDCEEYIIGEKSETEAIALFFESSQKLDTDKVKIYISKMKELLLNACIIVCKDDITAPARKVVDELQEYKIEIFKETSLRYNITKHRLVPKHTLLSKAEAQDFKKNYGIKIFVLLKTDPIAQFYNFQRGDIVRIDRADGVVFRIVK